MKIKIYLSAFIIFFFFTACSAPKLTPVPEQLKEGDERLIRGNSFLETGNYEEAGENFLKAYRLYSMGDDIKGCGASLAGLSSSLFKQNRKDEAKLLFDKANSYYRTYGNENELSYLYITRGLILLSDGDTKGAEAFFERAVKLRSKDSRLNTALALLEIKKGNNEKAENYLSKRDKDKEIKDSFLFYTSGLLDHKLKRFDSAKKNLLKALEIDKEKGDSPKIASDLEALFFLTRDEKKIKEAENYLLRSLKIYALIKNSEKAENLIRELKKIKKDSNEDISVDAYFLKIWTNE